MPPKALTETEFLRQQADEARQAMSRMVPLIGKNVGHGVDPRVWTRAHPWTVLGAAVVGGFAAASVIPSHDQRELNRQRRRARKRGKVLREHFDRQFNKAGFNGSKQDEKPGLLHRLIHELLFMARPVILELISGIFRGPPVPPEPQVNGNGAGNGMDPQPQQDPQEY